LNKGRQITDERRAGLRALRDEHNEDGHLERAVEHLGLEARLGDLLNGLAGGWPGRALGSRRRIRAPLHRGKIDRTGQRGGQGSAERYLVGFQARQGFQDAYPKLSRFLPHHGEWSLSWLSGRVSVTTHHEN